MGSISLPIAILHLRAWVTFLKGKLAEIERLDSGSEEAPRVLFFSDHRFASVGSKRIHLAKLFVPAVLVMTIVWIEEAVRHGSAVVPEISRNLKDYSTLPMR
jgi:hypothetical protein